MDWVRENVCDAVCSGRVHSVWVGCEWVSMCVSVWVGEWVGGWVSEWVCGVSVYVSECVGEWVCVC